MKVLLLIETLSVGGAETFVIRLANALAQRHELILAVMHGHRVEQQLVEQLDPRVQLRSLRLPAERWLWRADRVLRSLKLDVATVRLLQERWLRRLVRREQPDVLHSHLFKADRLAARVRSEAAKLMRHVITLHGDYAPYLRGQADPQMLDHERWIERVLISADAVVGVASEHVDEMSTLYPPLRGKLHLIYNGYSTPSKPAQSINLPAGKFLFGMVSRGVEQKGWALAVGAFAGLRRKDAALVLVGEGPAIERLRRQRVPGVIFAGFSPRPTDWIDRFDVCLLPTLYPHESLPTVIIEYLASGKPVIASDVGEIGAMLRGRDGRMAGRLLTFSESGVSVQELQGLMASLMDDSVARTTMAGAAHDAFARFSMSKCAAAYERLYRGDAVSSSISSTH